MIKEVYYIKPPKKEKIINILIILFIILGFIFICKEIGSLISFVILLLTFYKKKDEFFQKDSILLNTLIAFDEENNMYLIYIKNKIYHTISGLLLVFLLISMVLENQYLFNIIFYISCVIINLDDFYKKTKSINYKNNLESISNLINQKNKGIKKVENIASSKEGIYVFETVDLYGTASKESKTYMISKQYENYDELIKKIESLIN